MQNLNPPLPNSCYIDTHVGTYIDKFDVGNHSMFIQVSCGGTPIHAHPPPLASMEVVIF